MFYHFFSEEPMQRPMNAGELDHFYRRAGAALWHVQYLEDVLVNFLTTKILQERRSVGQSVARADGEALLAQSRRKLTLGPLIQACIDKDIITSSLATRFEAFKIDRHWLVHRSLVENGDDLFNDSTREAVFNRILSVQEEAISLKKLIVAALETWLNAQGVDVKAAEKQGKDAFRKLSGF